MTTMTAEHLSKNTGAVRRALVGGEEVRLTFHGKPYARVIADDRVQEERAELERLRAEVAALRNKLEEAAIP
ncbi:hypothetical protein [Amycolatopsis sacchari]|uniref:hypothetical protein n=1 Tax=Amycolatopsis sacchari TaxID=115433 RepID=UPI003D725062